MRKRDHYVVKDKVLLGRVQNVRGNWRWSRFGKGAGMDFSRDEETLKELKRIVRFLDYFDSLHMKADLSHIYT